MSRTPLAYLLTIALAENVFGFASPGTHTWSKYINPSELLAFFAKELKWLPEGGVPPRSDQAQVRGMMYHVWGDRWGLIPKGAPLELDVNYIMWVRRPMDA